MKNKTGVIIAIVIGVLLVCCGGGALLTRSAFSKVRETVAKDREFVKEVLTKTASSWNEEEFSKFADDSFNTAENRSKTKRMFSVFSVKLGKLKSLGVVGEPTAGSRRIDSDPKSRGFFIAFNVPAEFEKGQGKFEVVVRNDGPKLKVHNIKLDSDKLFEMSDQDLEKAKDAIKHAKPGTAK